MTSFLNIAQSNNQLMCRTFSAYFTHLILEGLRPSLMRVALSELFVSITDASIGICNPLRYDLRKSAIPIKMCHLSGLREKNTHCELKTEVTPRRDLHYTPNCRLLKWFYTGQTTNCGVGDNTNTG